MSIKLIKSETHTKWGLRHLVEIDGDRYVLTAKSFNSLVKPN